MKNKNKISVGNLWHAVNPLILYYLLSIGVSAVMMQKILLQAGFAVMESSIGEDGILEYVFQEFLIQTMEMVLLTAVVCIPIFGWMYYRDLQKRGQLPEKGLQLVVNFRALLWGLLGSAALALLCNNLIALTPLVEWSAGYEETSEALYAGSIWMEFLGAGFGAAAVEELLMRGLLYQRLRDMMQAGAAIFWSALIFGISHGNIVQGVYAFLLGMFFAWLKERFGTILIPIAAHMSANLFVIMLSESHGLRAIAGTYAGYIASTVLCGVCFIYAFRTLNCMKNEIN